MPLHCTECESVKGSKGCTTHHHHLHHLTQKGLIGCPVLTTYCFPPMLSERVNTLIRCDKFNELVPEEEKLPIKLYTAHKATPIRARGCVKYPERKCKRLT
ncbi:unnamed protein product [Pleuronectes platessa]|uniref:Uncharacterized protein n=1 Tax=Pleuronectes platessa TaxID=8262 RepID=A0A9N7TSA0_PLEPL|nr:unnamed protein product [Pleuronectes platessa]